MKKSTKIWICITGLLLVVLGIVCIAKPADTLFATAWMIGVFTLVSGIAELAFTLNTQHFLPNSGTRMLSALLQIILGCIFLASNLFLAASLPFIFALWVMIEGVVIAIRAFDYKKVGFKYWWCLLLLGIVGAVLGCLGLRYPKAAGCTLTTLIGIGIIANGMAYLVAIAGLNRFEKKLNEAKDAFRDTLG